MSAGAEDEEPLAKPTPVEGEAMAAAEDAEMALEEPMTPAGASRRCTSGCERTPRCE